MNARWDRSNKRGYVENEDYDDPDDTATMFGFDTMIEEQEAKEQAYAIDEASKGANTIRGENGNNRSGDSSLSSITTAST